MKTQASRQMNAPIAALWEVIAQGGGVERWFSSTIATCELSGAGEGAARHCTMTNGAILEERVLAVDHATHTFRYAIDQHPLPASDVVATLRLSQSTDGKTAAIWGADYTTAPETADLMTETLTGLYEEGLRSLDAHVVSINKQENSHVS